MNSGIEISDEVLTTYKQLALKRAHRYIIMKPSDDGTKIEIEKIGARDETFDQFVESVPKQNAR
jgi:cofilin